MHASLKMNHCSKEYASGLNTSTGGANKKTNKHETTKRTQQTTTKHRWGARGRDTRAMTLRHGPLRKMTLYSTCTTERQLLKSRGIPLSYTFRSTWFRQQRLFCVSKHNPLRGGGGTLSNTATQTPTTPKPLAASVGNLRNWMGAYKHLTTVAPTIHPRA